MLDALLQAKGKPRLSIRSEENLDTRRIQKREAGT